MCEHRADHVAGMERSRSEVNLHKLLSPTRAHVPTVVSLQQLTSREILERDLSHQKWRISGIPALVSLDSDTWSVHLTSGLLHRHCRKPRFTKTGSGVMEAVFALLLWRSLDILSWFSIQNSGRFAVDSNILFKAVICSLQQLSTRRPHCSSLAFNFINLKIVSLHEASSFSAVVGSQV